MKYLSDIEIVSCLGRQIHLMTSLVIFNHETDSDMQQVNPKNISRYVVVTSFLNISALEMLGEAAGMPLGTQSTIVM